MSTERKDSRVEFLNTIVPFTEGFVSAENVQASTRNVFGRNIQFSFQGDIAWNLGLAATGLRTLGFIDGNKAKNAGLAIKQATGQKLSTVLLVSYNHLTELKELLNSGAFVLSASTWQEVFDFTCLAWSVSEESLIPGIVIFPKRLENVEFNASFDKHKVKGFIGNPDQWIESPTPAQKLIFGEKRKQIPNWFDPDLPVTIGSIKNTEDEYYDRASHESFISSHLVDIMNENFKSFNKEMGRSYDEVFIHPEKRSDSSVITIGEDLDLIDKTLESYKSRKSAISFAQLQLLRPFPQEKLVEFISDKKNLLVLEKSLERDLFEEVQKRTDRSVVYSGLYKNLNEENLGRAVDNMLNKGIQNFWLDISLSQEKSKFPKHDVLLHNINRSYPDLLKKNLVSNKSSEGRVIGNQVIPQKVRKLRDSGPAYTKAARFFDDTALMYNIDEKVADPFQAINVLPSETASFKDNKREYIPVLKPESCTGCGDCFVVCPHSALPPVASSISDIIKGGMAKSKENGKVLKSLTPLVKTLATAANKEVKTKGSKLSRLKEFLPEVAQKVFKQKRLEGEKLDLAISDIKVLMNLVGDVPFAVNDTFFTEQNSKDPTAGELFFLGLDTSACIGCGICANACHDDALEMVSQTPDLLQKANVEFEQFENLSTTSQEVIDRLFAKSDYDSLAALLFDQKYYQSINGASSEHEPAQKVVLHLTAAILEDSVKEKVEKTVSSIDDLVTKLETIIRKNLSDALPSSDFDSLNKSLEAAHGQRIPFDEMIANWGSKEHLKLVNTADLQLRMNLIHDLKEIKWALLDGPTGQGRSTYSLLVDSSLSDFVQYPWSTFTSPVLVNWDSSGTAMTEGLIKGCIRHTLDNVKIMRRAQLVSQKKYNPAVHDEELAGLNWADLTAAEMAVVMPVVLITTKDSLESNNKLLHLLQNEGPVKIVVIDNAVSNPETAIADLSNSQSMLIPIIAQKKAVVLKSSLADRDHFLNGLKLAMSGERTAICWLLAPRANSHSTPWQKWPMLNTMALNTRAFTHLQFDPDSKATMLSSAIDIENNPMPKNSWNELDLIYSEEGEEKNLPYSFTWADWAFTQYMWRGDFVELPADTETLTVSEYLDLDPRKRKSVTPVILRINQDNGLQKYKPSNKVLDATEALQTSWRAVQEFAGLLTAFPEKLRREVEAEFETLKNIEIKKLEKSHQDKIASLEGEYFEKMKIQIKEKLMDLSKMME